jgi:hypothetical protein
MGSRVAEMRKKEEDLFIRNVLRKDHPPMFSHDTPEGKPHRARTRQALTIEEATDLLLQACGLARAQKPDQFNQSQQGMHSFADWRRLLGLQPIGPFAPIWLTRNGLVKRLLRAGPASLQEIWEVVNTRLATTRSQAVPATLAAFASGILCLDETRLDVVGRYLKPLRGLRMQDPACTALKLVGLFDLRAQRWVRLEWREAGPRELSSGYARLPPRTLARELAALRPGVFQLRLF